MSETMPATPITEETRLQGLLRRFLDYGFLIIATLFGVLFLLEGQGWATLSPPLNVLILAAWCPFLWGKYWAAKRETRWMRWCFFACAILVTATVIVAAVAILVKLAR